MRPEAVGAAGAVQRSERLGRRKAERVRRPVERLDETETTGRGRSEQRTQVVRHDARNVGVDDEDPARSDVFQGGLHGRALAASRIGDDFGAGFGGCCGALVVGRHDAGLAD